MHANAAGLGIAADHIQSFLDKFNQQYEDVDQTPTYWVDYIWDINSVDSNKILSIGGFNIYGQNIPESLVCLKDIPLSQCKVSLMGVESGRLTLKIALPGGVSLIKFKASEELYEEMLEENKILTAIGSCNINEWNGNVSPQILIEDFELRTKWVF